MINKNSPLPIYYQIEEEIKHLIISKQLKPGDLLPSEREYAEKYDVSRMTVRQAINNLANDGLLYRQKGKGTYIKEQKFEQNLQGLTSFSEDMRKRGFIPSNHVINFEIMKGSKEITTTLKIRPDDDVYAVRRIRLANDEPMAIETIYTPVKVIGTITKEVFTGSFYKYIEENLHYSIRHGDQIIESTLANSFEIEHLKINNGDPIMLMQRTSYLSDGQETPLEYVKSAYRADKYKFRIQIKR